MLTNSIVDDIKHRFRYGNMAMRLIFVNVGVFLFFTIFHLVVWLTQSGAVADMYTLVLRNVQVPASIGNLLHQPLSVFTYMFLHTDLLHILFNMLWLYWFSEIFVLFLGDKKIIPLYLFGGLMGAAFYMAAFNLFPLFAERVNISYMMGASASVFAVVFAAATLSPDYEIRLLFFGNVKIKWVALVALLLNFISISRGQDHNEGGYIAHVGGALAGFLYVKLLQSGFNIASPFQKFAGLFNRKKNVKVVYRNTDEVNKPGKPRTDDEQARIDEILDKISRSGYESLTKEEKDFLFHYSKK